MLKDTASTKLIEFSLDYLKPAIYLETDWWVIFTIILAIGLLYYFFKSSKNNNYPVTELEVEISGSPKAKFKAKRDESTLYIANRIYIELITRKAAIPVQKSDVIVEIYDSWYSLFKILRDEIKSVPGHYLQDHDSTNALIGLTTKILNEGLRPHLTKYQAQFRKWYKVEVDKESNKDLPPQEIQKKYPNYEELYQNMQEVNDILIQYSEELEKLIKGK